MTRSSPVLAVLLVLSIAAGAVPPEQGITIDLARGTEREKQTKQTLEKLLAAFDLKKYTFTGRVVIAAVVDRHGLRVK